jgi:hypothetical protein
MEDPHAQIERALIEEFLKARGHTLAELRGRDDPEAHALLKQASAHAASKLAEVESRAHLLREIHGERGASD